MLGKLKISSDDRRWFEKYQRYLFTPENEATAVVWSIFAKSINEKYFFRSLIVVDFENIYSFLLICIAKFMGWVLIKIPLRILRLILNNNFSSSDQIEAPNGISSETVAEAVSIPPRKSLFPRDQLDTGASQQTWALLKFSSNNNSKKHNQTQT